MTKYIDYDIIKKVAEKEKVKLIFPKDELFVDLGGIISVGGKYGIIKPNNVVGTMELLPSEQILFDDIKNTIENVFKGSGFLPIDTPVFGKNEILFAKGEGETTKPL